MSATGDVRSLSVGRVVAAPPERVYRAFVDPGELARWLHPPGFGAEVHHLEPEMGGTYRITMTGEAEEFAGYDHSDGGRYRELVPGERIVQPEVFESDDPGMAGELTVTATFEAVTDGTEVTVHLEMPADWPDDGISGWKAALGNLAGLLEERG